VLSKLNLNKFLAHVRSELRKELVVAASVYCVLFCPLFARVNPCKTSSIRCVIAGNLSLLGGEIQGTDSFYGSTSVL